jgi:hypothetical protein
MKVSMRAIFIGVLRNAQKASGKSGGVSNQRELWPPRLEPAPRA